MKKLLSLPPNLVNCFHDVTGYDKGEWFCTSDPVGHKLGSGGGSIHLLREAFKAMGRQGQTFDQWLSEDKRLLLHAGGQSRRLPAYAPSGKVLTPIPVFRWERGQRLSQDLLSLQVPLYQKILEAAPDSLHTMIVSGDVLIRTTQPLQPIPPPTWCATDCGCRPRLPPTTGCSYRRGCRQAPFSTCFKNHRARCWEN